MTSCQSRIVSEIFSVKNGHRHTHMHACQMPLRYTQASRRLGNWLRFFFFPEMFQFLNSYLTTLSYRGGGGAQITRSWLAGGRGGQRLMSCQHRGWPWQVRTRRHTSTSLIACVTLYVRCYENLNDVACTTSDIDLVRCQATSTASSALWPNSTMPTSPWRPRQSLL